MIAASNDLSPESDSSQGANVEVSQVEDLIKQVSSLEQGKVVSGWGLLLSPASKDEEFSADILMTLQA